MSKKRPMMSRSEPEGTPAELEEAFKVAESYLYKIINYGDKEEVIPKEELDKERRIFQFAKQGPRAAFFRLEKRGKLTSADVLYFMSTTKSSRRLAAQYDIEASKIREIRRGDSEEWAWEYNFVKRLKAILKGEMTRARIEEFNRNRLYSLSKVTSPTSSEILYYTTSLNKAKKLREDIIPIKSLTKMKEEGTLDILYPIVRHGVMK